jgi:hypothetical protein
MTDRATLVSAYYGGVNSNRSIDEYFAHGVALMMCDAPKVIYADAEMYARIEPYANSRTVIRLVRKQDIYLFEHRDEITDFSPLSTSPMKDTVEFMFVMCNKTETVRSAIELNPFGSKQFIWVDFGIRHVFAPQDDFQRSIERMAARSCNRVRIGSIWPCADPVSDVVEFYRDVAWYFAGGVFGGEATALLDFAECTKRECIAAITTVHTITWEVNIWYLVYRMRPELLEPYACDHTSALVDLY